MRLTVEYSATRREVMKWYWRAWKAGLWQTNAILCGCVGLIIVPQLGRLSHLTTSDLIAAIFLTLLPQLLTAVYPMIKFKPQQRSLTINNTGWESQIGNKSGSVSWTEVRNVEAWGDDTLIVGKTGNALIVPQRAFASREAAYAFFDLARALHRSANQH